MSDLLEALKTVKEGPVRGATADETKPRIEPLSGNLTLGKVTESLGSLNSQLKELSLEQWAESDLLTGSTGSGNAYSELESQVQSLLQEPEPGENKKPVAGKERAAVEGEASVTYELRYKPEHSRAQGLAQINAMEQRIKRLETLLGNDDNKISFLTSLTNEKTLSEAVQVLSARVGQLDGSQLEQMDGRLTSVLHKLNQMSEKKAILEDAEKQNKISELFDLMQKTDSYRASLPVVASRLNSVAELQEQAVQFSGAISYLDSMQSQIAESLKNNDEDLKLVRETFGQNMEFLKNTLEEMDKRINALK
jgi:dynactin-2